jgi:hypothetical protein
MVGREHVVSSDRMLSDRSVLNIFSVCEILWVLSIAVLEWLVGRFAISVG